jgi:hypothetical protein
MFAAQQFFVTESLIRLSKAKVNWPKRVYPTSWKQYRDMRSYSAFKFKLRNFNKFENLCFSSDPNSLGSF